MFNVQIHAGAIVRLIGCPSDAVAACDFRRAHGLPDGPDDRITLPGYAAQDEPFVRSAPRDKRTGGADLDSRQGAGRVGTWRCNAAGELWQCDTHQLHASGMSGYWPYVHPYVVADYLREQTPTTARALLEDVWAGEQRSRDEATEEAARIRLEKAERERAIAQARELLKPELEALTRRAELAEGMVKELRDAIDADNE
jgi:hypothetical protein